MAVSADYQNKFDQIPIQNSELSGLRINHYTTHDGKNGAILVYFRSILHSKAPIVVEFEEPHAPTNREINSRGSDGGLILIPQDQRVSSAAQFLLNGRSSCLR